MIKVTLADTLNELGITRNKLAVEAKIRPATLHEMVNGQSSSIRFSTLDVMLDTINDLSRELGIDKIYTVTDIIDYEYERGE